ncbi:MAG: cyclase family protein [Ardenticatenales bacterium]|nr:cyclase family protein [Ardenticatenales bacterium]
MTIYDVSVPISNQLPVWPGDPAIEVTRTGKMEEGSPVNVSQLRMGTHTGTHIDPPFHFLPDGCKVDELPLERLIGPAWLADCRGTREVTREVLAQASIPGDVTRLLLLTDNSAIWENPTHEFDRGFVDIAVSGAEWMVERGIQLVAIDYMSADNIDDENGPAHHVLLPNDVLIIENVDLRHVPPNQCYELICLPLKVQHGDGAPARVVLRTIENVFSTA